MMDEVTVSAEDELASMQAERLHPSMQKIGELFPEKEGRVIARDISHVGAALAAAVVNQAIDQSVMEQMTERFAASIEEAKDKESFNAALSHYFQESQALLNGKLSTLLLEITEKVRQGSFSAKEKERIISCFDGVVKTAMKQPIATIFGIGELAAFFEADFSGTPEKAADMARLLEILQGDLESVLKGLL